MFDKQLQLLDFPATIVALHSIHTVGELLQAIQQQYIGAGPGTKMQVPAEPACRIQQANTHRAAGFGIPGYRLAELSALGWER